MNQAHLKRPSLPICRTYSNTNRFVDGMVLKRRHLKSHEATVKPNSSNLVIYR